MKQLTDHYLRTALLLGFVAAALWTLVTLFGFTSLEASGADATASALGLVICFLVTFIVVVLILGVYDVWNNTKAEDVLETALWAAPVQHERLGFVLMAGSLLLLVSAATGAITQPLWPALSGLSLFGGGLILVFTALQSAEPISPLAVWRARYPTRHAKANANDEETSGKTQKEAGKDGTRGDEEREDATNENKTGNHETDDAEAGEANGDEVPEQDETKTSDGGSTPQAPE